MGKVLTGNGKSSCRTPDYSHQYDKVGARIIRELAKDGLASINTDRPIEASIAKVLTSGGVARLEYELGSRWILKRIAPLNREPTILR